MRIVSCGIAAVLSVLGLLGCVHVDDVRASELRPRYLRPTVASRSTVPLVLVYDPRELPEVVEIAAPEGFPPSKLLGARSLVTEHLRSGMEALFEQVSVVDAPSRVPAGALTGVVHFVEIGVSLAPGGKTIVGTLEWSLTLTRPGDARPIYSWGEHVVGTREGAGAFGHLDPATEVTGAIEASLRALLKDMADKGVVTLDIAPQACRATHPRPVLRDFRPASSAEPRRIASREVSNGFRIRVYMSARTARLSPRHVSIGRGTLLQRSADLAD